MEFTKGLENFRNIDIFSEGEIKFLAIICSKMF